MSGRFKGALGASMLALCAGCATARVTLPAPPPLQSDLQRWEEPPPLGPEPEARLPLAPSRTQLNNGVGVTVVARPETALAVLRLRVPLLRDRSEGPVAVMAEALRAGTRLPDGQTLLNPKIGMRSIGIHTDETGTTFSWDVLPGAVDQALRVLSAFLRAPLFEESEVNIQLNLELALIQQASGTWGHARTLAQAAFPGLERPSPEQDAYGLLKLKPALLRQIHACTMQPPGAELVVVGPVVAERVAATAQQIFGSWQAQPSGGAACAWPAPAAPEHPEKSQLARPELQIIYGGLDPWIAIEVPGPSIESDDHLPFSLLAEILAERDAGSAKQLRHAGATYGIQGDVYSEYSQLSLLDLSGQVEPDSAQEALRQLVLDIRSLAQSLEPSELDNVKRRWRNQLVNSASSNHAVAGLVLDQLRRKRDPAALPDLPNEVMQVDLAHCRAVAERWLTTAQPSIVVTGLPVKLVQGLGISMHVREMYWTDEPLEKKKLH